MIMIKGKMMIHFMHELISYSFNLSLNIVNFIVLGKIESLFQLRKKKPVWSEKNEIYLSAVIVKEPGFKNVKNKHLGMPPFLQNFHLFYPLVHSIGSMKPDIAINLSLANIPVTVCLKRYPSVS